MTNRLARRLPPSRACEHVDEVWGPHEGCKEFMDSPDEIPCGERAVKDVRLMQRVQEGRSVVRVRLCAKHASEYARDGQFTEAVLVRSL